MEIANFDKLDEQFVWRDGTGLVTKALGAAAGSQTSPDLWFVLV